MTHRLRIVMDSNRRTFCIEVCSAGGFNDGKAACDAEIKNDDEHEPSGLISWGHCL